MEDRPVSRRLLIEVAPAVLLALLSVKLLVLAGPLENGYVHYPIERRAASATFGILLLAAALLALLPRPGRAAAALVLNAIVSVVALADLLHIEFFGDVVSVTDLSRAGQLPGVLPSVMQILRPIHLLLFVDVTLGAALLPAWLRAGCSDAPLPFRIRTRLAAVLAAAGILVGLPAAVLVARDDEDVFQFAYTHRQIALAVGLLSYHVYDAAAYAAYPLRQRLGIAFEERESVRAFLAGRRDTDGSPSPLFGAARGANVVLVMAESLHDFPIGLRVGGRPVTPHLNAFALESLRFVNFFDQTHLGATSDGDFVSLQSLHPIEAGAVATRFGANDWRGLPAVLAERGYESLSIAGQPPEYWNMRGMHERLGFRRSAFTDGDFANDRATVAKAVPLIRQLRRPFVVHLVSFTSHHPFTFVPKRETLLSVGELEGTLTGSYLQSVHYFDQAFDDLLGALRRNGLLEDSIVMVYGDHRARLPEPELIRLLRLNPGDEIGRWLESRRLPLLIRLPGGAHAAVQTRAGGHLDIGPTVLALLGIPDTAAVMLGRDLTRAGRHPVVFRDGSFTDGRRHFLRRFGPPEASLARDDRNRRLEPKAVEEERRRADEELRVSDLIVEGNLLPWLREALQVEGLKPESEVAATARP